MPINTEDLLVEIERLKERVDQLERKSRTQATPQLQAPVRQRSLSEALGSGLSVEEWMLSRRIW